MHKYTPVHPKDFQSGSYYMDSCGEYVMLVTSIDKFVHYLCWSNGKQPYPYVGECVADNRWIPMYYVEPEKAQMLISCWGPSPLT